METEMMNIPMDLLKKLKDDKDTLELLALSVIIKIKHADSLLKDVTPVNVMNMCHCAHTKAVKLIERAKENSAFFEYNEKYHTLYALNFKKPYEKTFYDKRGRLQKSMYAFKIEKKDYQLRNLVRLFKDVLLLNAINAIERNDVFRSKGKSLSSTLEPHKPLTQKHIAKVTGLNNRKAVYRMVKRLEKEGSISYTKAQLLYSTNCLSDEAIRERNLDETFLVVDEHTGAGYVVAHAKYHIKNREITNRITNIILTHKKRLASRMPKHNELTAIELYFERNEH